MHHRVRTEHLIKKLRVNELRGEISFYPLPFVRSRANFGEWILEHRRVREMDGKRDVKLLCFLLLFFASFFPFSFFARFEEFERKGFGSNYITSRVFIFKRLNESLIGSVSMKDDLYFRGCVHRTSNKNNKKLSSSYCPR